MIDRRMFARAALLAVCGSWVLAFFAGCENSAPGGTSGASAAKPETTVVVIRPSTTPKESSSGNGAEGKQYERSTSGPASEPAPEETGSPTGGFAGTGEASGENVPETWVVADGDSLWAISEAVLGPDATPEEVYYYTGDLYAANADVVGDDPNLIFPGEALVLPPAKRPGESAG